MKQMAVGVVGAGEQTKAEGLRGLEWKKTKINCDRTISVKGQD